MMEQPGTRSNRQVCMLRDLTLRLVGFPISLDDPVTRHFRDYLLPGRARNPIFALRLDLCCSGHLPYGIYDHLRAVNLHVVAATLGDNQGALRGKSGELLLQPHQRGLPFLKIGPVICRRDDGERDVWKRTAICDLPIAFGDAFFLEVGRRSRLKTRARLQFTGRIGARGLPRGQRLTRPPGTFSQTFARTGHQASVRPTDRAGGCRLPTATREGWSRPRPL